MVPAAAGKAPLLRHLRSLQRQAKEESSAIVNEIREWEKERPYRDDPVLVRLMILHYRLGKSDGVEETCGWIQDLMAGRFPVPEDEGVVECETPHSPTSALA